MSDSTLTFEPGGALRSRLVSVLIDESRHVLEAGAGVGPFRVVRMIGHGGLGVVYLAERADGAFEQQVALKLIAAEVDSGVAGVLLERERRLLARLQHPNIARLLDGGRTEDGVLWFAMDHVAGERIDRWCDARALDAPARVRLVLDVCAAVAYAHARLVVHRDIKPSNVLVDDSGAPRLVDFGIAAALDDASEDPARHAATPAYASPEQHRGDPAGVTQDVFQLGRLLQTLLQDGFLRGYRDDFDAIVTRACAPRAEHRYASVDALASDLRALLDRRPVSARAAGAGYRFGLLLRRQRLAAAAIATALLLLAGTTSYFLWHLAQARTRAEREAQTARRVGDFLVGLFQAADPALHQGRMPTLDAVLADAPARIERDLAGEPAVMAELLATIGGVHVALRDFAGAAEPLRKSVALSRELDDLPPAVLAERLRLLSLASEGAGPQAGRALLEEALSLLDANSPEQARIYNILQQNLAMDDLAAGNKRAAIVRLRAALEHGRRLLGEGQPSLVADRLGLGSALLSVGEDAEALQHYGEADAAAREHLGARHPYAILAAGGLAVSLARTGQPVEAARHGAEAVDGALQVYGEGSPNYVLALLQQADVYARDGRQADSIAILQRALAICDRLGGNDVLSVDVLEALGDAQLASGDATAAERSYREMLARNRDGARAQEPDVGQRRFKLASALAAQGRCGEAFEERRRARARAAGLAVDARLAQRLRQPLASCAD